MRATRLAGVVVLLASISFAQQPPANPPAAAPQTPPAPPSVTQVLDRQFSGLERGLIALAEAMPEDKFNFKPSGPGEFSDVRTFEGQLKHIAAGNFVFASMLNGEASPIASLDQMTTGPAGITGKAAVLQYLKDSFAAAHKGLATVNEKNLTEALKFPFGEARMTRLGIANIFTWHGMDHYGQLVVYARMNGIVPPASRRN